MSNGLTPSARTRYSDHALAAYMAPLFQGRRVAVIGPTSGELARRCRALGAASAVSFGGQGDGIAVRPLTPGSLRGFRGRLDVVIVPEAGLVPLRGVLEEARHALGQDGVLAVASVGSVDRKLEAGSRERGPDYHGLYDALARDFSVVRMVGRGSFVGYALAALDGGDEGEGESVALDTRLMPDDSDGAEGFIAIAGDRAFALDPMAVVQVPAAEVLAATEQVVQRDPRDPGLVDERDRARAELARTTAELGSAQTALASAEGLRDELRGELATRDNRVRELENSAAERWVQLQRLEHQYKELDEEARKARDRAVRLAKDLDDERKLRQRVELETQMQLNRRATDLSPRAADGAELVRSRERIEQLERELSAWRSKVDGLVRELDETQATEGELRAQVDDAKKRVKKAGDDRQRAQEEIVGLTERVRAAEARVVEVEAKASATPAPVESPKGVDHAEYEALQAEYERLEKSLRERASEVTLLRGQLSERDAAVRELAFAVDVAERSEAAVERQRLRDQASALAGVNAALTVETRGLLEQNARLRDELARAADELTRAKEAVATAPTVAAAEENPSADTEEALHEAQAARAAAEFALDRAKRELDELRAAAVARGGEASASEIEGLRAAAADAARDRDRARAAGAELEREASAAKEREAAALAKVSTHEKTLAEQQRTIAEQQKALAESHQSAVERDKALGDEKARADRAEKERGAAVAAVDAGAVERAVAAEREKATQAVAAERIRVAELTKQLTDARSELSRQFALSASTEDRAQQAMLELEGTRAGFKRRTRELEREVEALVQALEIATTESKDELESLEKFMRDIENLKAEKTGVELRLRDSEASLTSLLEKNAATPPGSRTTQDLLAAPATPASGLSSEELLADLAETAARLAATEEALSQARDLATEAEARAELSRRDLDKARSDASRAPSAGQLEALETLRRESGEREVLVRSLVAQLEDRDLRLRSMERRLVEEVERARRTESEIWEVELRTRDQRIAQLAREADRARGEERGDTGAGLRAELEAMRANLSGRDTELQRLRASIDVVRSGLSSILVDGRGAVVAHDLVTILRQIDDTSPS